MDHDICHSSSKGMIFPVMFTKRICIINWRMYYDICQKLQIPKAFLLNKFHAGKSIHKESPIHPPPTTKIPGGFTEKDSPIPSRCNAFVCEAIPHPTDPPGTAHHDGLEDSELSLPFLPPVAVWWSKKGLAYIPSWGNEEIPSKSQLGRLISFSQLMGYDIVLVSLEGKWWIQLRKSMSCMSCKLGVWVAIGCWTWT